MNQDPLHAGREFRDALPTGTVRGRGAGLNPGNRFEDVRLHVLGETLDERAAESPGGVQVRTKTLDDSTRSIINAVDSPDLSFKWTVNPYRGCEHGCIYCYARPGHEYLGLSSGLDFETTIIAKHEAPTLLRKELSAKKWRGESIVMSGVTDCYQPLERELRITRRCLEVCLEFRQSVSIITKNALVLRDIDLISRLHEHRLVAVALSITTLDAGLARVMEPRASVPKERLRALRELSAVGVPTTVMTAPIIPAINDHEIPAILAAAAEAGARSAGYVLLRLPYQIKALYEDWLRRHFPDRAEKALSLLRSTRGGELYDATAFTRMKGTGPYAAQIRSTFTTFAKRHRFNQHRTGLNTAAFRRPGEQTLFD